MCVCVYYLNLLSRSKKKKNENDIGSQIFLNLLICLNIYKHYCILKM